MKKNSRGIVLLTPLRVVGLLFLLLAGQQYGHALEPDKDPGGASRGQTAFYEKLIKINQVKLPPGPNDWLAAHAEPGQTFSEYVASHPPRPDQKRRIIYLALLGDFNGPQLEIIQKTAEILGAYYGLPVKFAEPIALSAIPPQARRVHPQTGDKQILSTYVLDEVLKPRLPDDGFCLLAFTASDLWPGEGWNFVFGQASPTDRVGVWSIYRNGDPQQGRESFQLCLLRTSKTATHETGHMLGMEHCVFYECNMNGSNYRRESDLRPLWLCPVCLRKVVWATGTDPVERYRQLDSICRRLGLQKEAEFYDKVLRLFK